MLFNKQTFFIKYDFHGEAHHCQIEAIDKQQAEQIFKQQHGFGCFIKSIKSVDDLSNDISENLMTLIRNQFNNIKL